MSIYVCLRAIGIWLLAPWFLKYRKARRTEAWPPNSAPNVFFLLTSDPRRGIFMSDADPWIMNVERWRSEKENPLISNKWLFLSFLACTIFLQQSTGQSVEHPDTLFVTIKSLDAKLFNAVNNCDLSILGSMVSDDLEFYHDQTGLSVGKAPFLAAIKQNICGKVQRTLIENTLEVYPLNGYGAVEVGIHRFHHPNEPDNVGDAKFVHIWHNDNGVWKITRVISYEHNEGLLAK